MTTKEERMMIIRKIIEYINDGVFEVNKKIYSENQLAYILNTSRNKVREALISLEIMGIVESRQGEGTYLKEPDIIGDKNPIQLLLFLVKTNIEDIMQLREIIEVGLINYCKYNPIDVKVRDEMRACLYEMEHSCDPHIISRNDIHFHTLMAESVNNPAITMIMNVIVGYMNLISTNNWNSVLSEDGDSEKAHELLNQHFEIFDAIEENDCEKTIDKVRAHLNYISDNLNNFEL